MTVTIEQGVTAPFIGGYKRLTSPGFTGTPKLLDLLFGPSTPGVSQILLPRTGLVFICCTADAHDEMGRPAYSTNCHQIELDNYVQLQHYPKILIEQLLEDQRKGLTLKTPAPFTIQASNPQPFTKTDHDLLHGLFTDTQLLNLILALLVNSQRFYVSTTIKVPKPTEPLNIIYALLKLVPQPYRVFSWSTCRNGVFSPEQPHSLICFRDAMLHVRYDNAGGSYPPSLQFLARHLLKDSAVAQKMFMSLYESLPPKLAMYYAPIEFMADTSKDQDLMQWLIRQYLDAKQYSRVSKYAALLESLH